MTCNMFSNTYILSSVHQIALIFNDYNNYVSVIHLNTRIYQT